MVSRFRAAGSSGMVLHVHLMDPEASILIKLSFSVRVLIGLELLQVHPEALVLVVGVDLHRAGPPGIAQASRLSAVLDELSSISAIVPGGHRALHREWEFYRLLYSPSQYATTRLRG